MRTQRNGGDRRHTAGGTRHHEALLWKGLYAKLFHLATNAGSSSYALASRAREHAGEGAARICLTTATLRGERHRSRGNCLEAEAHLLRGLATAREFGIDSSETAGAENDLAVLYKYWGRFEQALALYSSALEKVRAIHGGDSLESATLFHNIGGVLHSRGDFAAAEQPARKAWDISRQHLGEDEPRALLDATALRGGARRSRAPRRERSHRSHLLNLVAAATAIDGVTR